MGQANLGNPSLETQMTRGCQIKLPRTLGFLVYLLQSVNESCSHEVVKCARVKSKGLGRGARLAVALQIYVS